MKLRKPCEHGRYDRHHLSKGLRVGDLTHCPGGEFLPEDALVIEKVEGEWPAWITEPFRREDWTEVWGYLNALADQVGEPQ